MVAQREYQKILWAHQVSARCHYRCEVVDEMRARFDSNGRAVVQHHGETDDTLTSMDGRRQHSRPSRVVTNRTAPINDAEEITPSTAESRGRVADDRPDLRTKCFSR